jgi:hypothetical protein
MFLSMSESLTNRRGDASQTSYQSQPKKFPGLEILGYRHSIKGGKVEGGDNPVRLSPEGISLAVNNSIALTRRTSAEASIRLRTQETAGYVMLGENPEETDNAQPSLESLRTAVNVARGITDKVNEINPVRVKPEIDFDSSAFYDQIPEDRSEFGKQLVQAFTDGVYLNFKVNSNRIASENSDNTVETTRVVSGRFARLITKKLEAYKRLLSADSRLETFRQSQENTDDFTRIMVSHQGNIESFYIEVLRAMYGNDEEVSRFANAIGGNGMIELSGFKLRVDPIPNNSDIIGFQTIFTIDSGDGKYQNTMVIPESILITISEYADAAPRPTKSVPTDTSHAAVRARETR